VALNKSTPFVVWLHFHHKTLFLFHFWKENEIKSEEKSFELIILLPFFSTKVWQLFPTFFSYKKFQGPYSQHIIFFVTYEWAQ